MDREALLQLDGAEMERQALVLLRKRFGRVRDCLPLTGSRWAQNAWPEFIGFSRERWPENGSVAYGLPRGSPSNSKPPLRASLMSNG